MREAKRRGQVVGRVPFGWRRMPDSRLIEPDPEEQQVLQQIRHWRAQGYALTTIADELNALGLRNRQGRLWARSFVGQLLQRHAEELA